METFEPFTETDIRQLLKRSSNAFCAVDPMPTWLVKDCLDVLISPITNIVNKSLSLGVLPRSMKDVLVDIRLWMTRNILKLNDNKTNII